MRRTITAALTALAAVALSGVAGARSDDARTDLKAIGLTSDQRLISFDTDNPRSRARLGTISGLDMDATIVGIDFRPADGRLYGLGDAGGVYTLDLATASATFVSRLNVPLVGTSFGVDFNPTVDRLRVISDAGQNLRVDVATGATTVDGALTYVGPPVTSATGVTGAAYTNNDADPNTATTLYDVDASLDQVVIQAPANAGTLSPTGKLRVDAGSAVGFDIYSVVRGGTTVDVLAFASLTSGGRTKLYAIALFSGRATSLGGFRGSDQVTDLALPLNQG